MVLKYSRDVVVSLAYKECADRRLRHKRKRNIRMMRNDNKPI